MGAASISQLSCRVFLQAFSFLQHIFILLFSFLQHTLLLSLFL